jgi:hypothetical protein
VDQSLTQRASLVAIVLRRPGDCAREAQDSRLLGVTAHGRGGVPPEQAPVADVASRHGDRAVPRLGHDLPLLDAGDRRRRRQAGSQAVAGVARGIEPGRRGRPLDDPGDVLVRQSGGPGAVQAIDGAEDRAVIVVELVQPRRQGTDGTGCRLLAAGDADLLALALLIRLAAPDGDDRALSGDLDVARVQRHQLGPAERPREAQQDDGAVADASRRVGQGRHQRLDVVGQQRGLADLGGPDPATDAAPDGPDAGVFGRRGKVSRAEGLSDRHQPPRQRGRPQHAGVRGEVEHERRSLSRQRHELVVCAPVGEVLPVGPVGSVGVLRPGRVEVPAYPLAERLQRRELTH